MAKISVIAGTNLCFRAAHIINIALAHRHTVADIAGHITGHTGIGAAVITAKTVDTGHIITFVIALAGLALAALVGTNAAAGAIMPFVAAIVIFAMGTADTAFYITGITAFTLIIGMAFLANAFMAAFALGTFIRPFTNGVANSFQTKSTFNAIIGDFTGGTDSYIAVATRSLRLAAGAK